MIRTLLALVGLCTLAYWLLGAKTVECDTCLNTLCLTSSGCGGNQCACVMPFGEPSGTCMRIQLVDLNEDEFYIAD